MAEKKHIFHGTINVAAAGAATSTAQQAGNVHFGQTVGRQDSAILNKAQDDMARKTAAFEANKKDMTLAIPTDDSQVKRRLREYGVPVCLFGEDAYERRERLRGLVQQRGAPKAAPVIEGGFVKEQDEMFYTEGTLALKEARMKIAKFSLPRAKERLAKQHAERETEDTVEWESDLNNYLDNIEGNLNAQLSQVGDNRPLTYGRFAPDGSKFAVSSWSGSVKVWDVATCSILKTYQAMEDRCNSVHWNPAMNSNVELAATSADHSLYIYSKDGQTQKIEGHEDRTNRAEFHPSGNYLLSTSHDNTWRMWDVETKKELLLQEGHAKATYGIAVHTDGALVATSDLGGVVRLWDLRSGRCLLPLIGHVKQVVSCNFSTSGHQLVTGGDDNSVRIWDLRKRKCTQNLLAHNKMVSEVKFDSTDRFILTSSYDMTLRIWSALDFKCKKTLVGHEARIMGADLYSDNNRLLVSSVAFDRTFKFWATNNDFEVIKMARPGP